MHGWLILDKPLGLGSTQGVSAVKRALREGGYGKAKVGHGGTLDPLASGVLPIALGEATKLAGRMLDSDKVYDFTIRFGEQTDTLDSEGKVIATSDVRPTRDALAAVLADFTGPIEQMPPAFSALKVDGQRAYDLARAGEEVVLKTRAVTVFSLSLAQAAEAGALEEATLSAHVSKGTYIRSLARDMVGEDRPMRPEARRVGIGDVARQHGLPVAQPGLASGQEAEEPGIDRNHGRPSHADRPLRPATVAAYPR